jgi:hypothetical protein
MRKAFRNLKYYILTLIIAIITPVLPVFAKENVSVNKTYDATAGTRIMDTLVYDSVGQLGEIQRGTINGIKLYAGTVNGKYGLCLGGTPIDPTPVTFKGVVDDNGTIDVAYEITINVAKEKKSIVKVYDIEIGQTIEDYLVYDSEETFKEAINTENKGLTLYSGTYNNVYGLHLKGTPTASGTISFSGTAEDGNKYTISYSVSVNVTKPVKEITKSYDATVGKRFNSTLVYESTGKLKKVDTTKNGITFRSSNVDGKWGLYIGGKATQSGEISFTGTVDEDGKTDIKYNITVTVAPRPEGEPEDEDEEEETTEEEEETEQEDDDDIGSGPISTQTTQTDDGDGLSINLIIGIASVALAITLIVAIIVASKKKKNSKYVEMSIPTGPNAAFMEAEAPAEPADTTETTTDTEASTPTEELTLDEDAAPAEEVPSSEESAQPEVEPQPESITETPAEETTPKQDINTQE